MPKNLAELAETKIEDYLEKASQNMGRQGVAGQRFGEYLQLSEVWIKVLKATKTTDLDEATIQAVEAIKRSYQ